MTQGLVRACSCAWSRPPTAGHRCPLLAPCFPGPRTQLLAIPDVGLLSSSLDATVKLLDLGAGRVANTFALHRKPVRSLAYSRAFSLVAR